MLLLLLVELRGRVRRNKHEKASKCADTTAADAAVALASCVSCHQPGKSLSSRPPYTEVKVTLN
jgi:mono/diheme cytochrome c family protein